MQSSEFGLEAAAQLVDPQPAVSVLIASDHPALSLGLRALFEREPRIAVVGEAATGAEAIQQVRLRRPAVLLLDVRSPGATELAAISAVCRATAVLVVS